MGKRTKDSARIPQLQRASLVFKGGGNGAFIAQDITVEQNSDGTLAAINYTAAAPWVPAYLDLGEIQAVFIEPYMPQ